MSFDFSTSTSLPFPPLHWTPSQVKPFLSDGKSLINNPSQNISSNSTDPSSAKATRKTQTSLSQDSIQTHYIVSGSLHPTLKDSIPQAKQSEYEHDHAHTTQRPNRTKVLPPPLPLPPSPH